VRGQRDDPIRPQCEDRKGLGSGEMEFAKVLSLKGVESFRT
jgi:hypothetical protein